MTPIRSAQDFINLITNLLHNAILHSYGPLFRVPKLSKYKRIGWKREVQPYLRAQMTTIIIGPGWFRFEGVARDENGKFMYALLEM